MQEPVSPRNYLPSKHFIKITLSIVLGVALVLGAIWVVRTILYRAHAGPSLSVTHPDGTVTHPSGDKISFFDLFSFNSAAPTGETVTPGVSKLPKNTISAYFFGPDKPAPVIESVTPSTFGNGDTITIHGRNFTYMNTVLLSIDLKGKYVNIPSFDGTTITITADLTLSDRLNQDFSNLTTDQREQVVNKIVSVKSKETGESGAWHMPATIEVQNQNGTSAPVNVFVDILKKVRV